MSEQIPVIREARIGDLLQLEGWFEGLDAATKRFFHPGFLGRGTLTVKGVLLRLLMASCCVKPVRGILMQAKPHYFMIPVVAVKEGVPIGFAFLLVEGERMGSGFTATLGIGVSSHYQGMGVGFSMMHFLIAKAKEWGVKHIILDVLEDNPRAIALYRKCGFRTTRTPVKKELWYGETLGLMQMAANVGSV